MDAHEIVVFSLPEVSVRLTASDGTTVRCDCAVTLTNQNIRLRALSADGATYRVKNRGDRTFQTLAIPIASAKPHRFIQPWLGPYRWETAFVTTAIEPAAETWTLQLTFNYGGAIEYREFFLRTYAEVQQAREAGMEEVLPAYSE